MYPGPGPYKHQLDLTYPWNVKIDHFRDDCLQIYYFLLVSPNKKKVFSNQFQSTHPIFEEIYFYRFHVQYRVGWMKKFKVFLHYFEQHCTTVVVEIVKLKYFVHCIKIIKYCSHSRLIAFQIAKTNSQTVNQLCVLNVSFSSSSLYTYTGVTLNYSNEMFLRRTLTIFSNTHVTVMSVYKIYSQHTNTPC